MDVDKNLSETKTHKILNTISKELRKLSPVGSSNRNLHADLNLPKGQTEQTANRLYEFAKRQKYINAPIISYIEKEFKVSSRHIRTPSSAKRSSLKDPCTPNNRTPARSPELIRINSLNKLNNLNRNLRDSPKLETVNGIIEACEDAAQKKSGIPKVMKSCSNKMTVLADKVEKVISKTRAGSSEYKKELQKEMIKDFYKNGMREMVETDLIDKKIGKEFLKFRKFGMPKHLENFLRVHTRYQ